MRSVGDDSAVLNSLRKLIRPLAGSCITQPMCPSQNSGTQRLLNNVSEYINCAFVSYYATLWTNRHFPGNKTLNVPVSRSQFASVASCVSFL